MQGHESQMECNAADSYEDGMQCCGGGTSWSALPAQSNLGSCLKGSVLKVGAAQGCWGVCGWHQGGVVYEEALQESV